MEIEKNVIINNKNEKSVSTLEDEAILYLDVPVTRANAVAFLLLQRIYSSSDELQQDDREDLVSFLERFSAQSTFSGSADDFHNFAVELARKDEYVMACDILEIGLNREKGGFSKNCDLLADYLQYGINCGRVKQAKEYFKTLMEIPRRRWTWRGFSFGISFLRHLVEQNDVDNEISDILSSVDCSMVDYEGLEYTELVMLAFVAEFKKFFPNIEEPYQIESQVYTYLKDEKNALNALTEAEKQISNCPKCSLRRADMLFERGEYDEASKSVNRALEDAVQTQSSVNEGYLHYLFSLCIIANARKKDTKLSAEEIDKVYMHFNIALVEFEDGRQSYKNVIRRNVRNLQTETGVEVPDKYVELSAITEE